MNMITVATQKLSQIHIQAMKRIVFNVENESWLLQVDNLE